MRRWKNPCVGATSPLGYVTWSCDPLETRSIAHSHLQCWNHTLNPQSSEIRCIVPPRTPCGCVRPAVLPHLAPVFHHVCPYSISLQTPKQNSSRRLSSGSGALASSRLLLLRLGFTSRHSFLLYNWCRSSFASWLPRARLLRM